MPDAPTYSIYVTFDSGMVHWHASGLRWGGYYQDGFDEPVEATVHTECFWLHRCFRGAVTVFEEDR